jgi:uncharacterized repeat protein (TIGR03803 family)
MRSKMFSSTLSSVWVVAAAASLILSTPAVAQKEKIWHNFPIANGVDGYAPISGVTFDANGSLWGTTTLGGVYGGGVVYKLYSPDGQWSAEEIVHSFNPNSKDGYDPIGGVIIGLKDGFYRGNIYGTTYVGGAHGDGTVYELSQLAGGGYAETILHSFSGKGTDGAYPMSSLVFDTAGNLYGTTLGGGSEDSGTVFELVSKAGGGWGEKILHSFSNNGTDGSGPFAGLIFDASGNLYGTTANGGAYGCGIVFELSPQTGGGWTESIVHSFANNTTDGCSPQAGLVIDRFGTFYGTTNVGGTYGYGTMYNLTQSGGSWTESVLHNFASNGDGAYPGYGALSIDGQGYPVGTTVNGGNYLGTMEYLGATADGGLEGIVWHTFERDGVDGYNPFSGVTLDLFGNAYGTTTAGGSGGGGIVYEVTN